MEVTFWGVRGSIPTPGIETVRVGGNTSCIEVRTADGDLLILDAGTGIRPLGVALQARSEDRIIGHIFLSHTHWDHIQGLPFFGPARQRGNRFTILGEKRVDERLERVLAGQYMDTYLPFSLKEMDADILVKEIRDGETVVLGEHTLVTARRMDHPGGVFSYRVRWRGLTLVYATDLRHPVDTLDERLIEFAQDADLLIHDAHFSPDEVQRFPDWGHSSWEQAVELAETARVKRLALFHYSPTSPDDMLEALEKQIQVRFPNVFLSREGLTVRLESPGQPVKGVHDGVTQGQAPSAR
jgi:phosphoribosyl 1,2-cyclic phosphodiesterase